jgi:hypothetical protein
MEKKLLKTLLQGFVSSIYQLAVVSIPGIKKNGEVFQIVVHLDRSLVSKIMFQSQKDISTDILPFVGSYPWLIQLVWESNLKPNQNLSNSKKIG